MDQLDTGKCSALRKAQLIGGVWKGELDVVIIGFLEDSECEVYVALEEVYSGLEEGSNVSTRRVFFCNSRKHSRDQLMTKN